MLDRSSIMPPIEDIDMNRLSIQERAKIIGCLVEGNSIRATSRMTGADKGTVIKLLADVGTACKAYHDSTVWNLPCKRVQCDEIWSFCYAKEKNVPAEYRGAFGFGDVYTWTALCADTKLIAAYRVDRRDEKAAYAFIHDLKKRLANRVQLTTDGYKPYLEAVEGVFRGNVDYSMLVKLYGVAEGKGNERRYSPGECCGALKRRISGNPEPKNCSTSFVERQNLTMRMSMRRFTRLTNAFSKKVENLAHAVALHFMFYNFGRIHQTLRVTPAMEAGLSDHVWSLEEIAVLVDAPDLVTA
jgi:IS1 family transposase